MKKLKYYVFLCGLLTMALTFNACGSDDDTDDGGYSSLIIGRWSYYSYTVSGGETVVVPIDDWDYTEWEFKKDGTYDCYHTGKGRPLHLEGTFKWKMEDGKLWVNADGYWDGVSLVRLNDTEFAWYDEDELIVYKRGSRYAKEGK